VLIGKRVSIGSVKVSLGIKKRVSRSFGGNLVLFVFLALVAIFISLPVIYILSNAFKPMEELFLFPPRFFPQNPTFDNFLTFASLAQNTMVPFSRYLFNSIYVAIIGTVAYIFIASLAAFPLAKHNFIGKATFLSVVVLAMLFRADVLGTVQYIIIAKLGMVDTAFALILPALSGTFGVFLMRQFMVAIPDAVLEAGKIDGATEFGIYWRIIMPQVKPAWLTLVIFTFQGFWGTTGMQYIYTESMKMFPTVMSQIASVGLARAGAGACIALIMIIPPVIIYLICQNSVLETMAHAGIK
jgi:putative chitobiose transport system permease protein